MDTVSQADAPLCLIWSIRRSLPGRLRSIAHIWQINLERDAIEEHIDVYFWPVRYGGLALAGLWISLLTYFHTRQQSGSGLMRTTEAT